ncbi:MAG: hypothetical protein ACRCW2_11760 [Cellulosilyticaceae bacterium]
MFQKFLAIYEVKMVEWFGYNTVVHGEEVVLVLGGIFIGVLIMAFISAGFIRDLYEVENFGESAFRMIRVTDKGQTKYVVSFRTYWEAFQQLLLLAFSPIFTVKNYTKRDERRTKRFLIVMFVAGVIVLAFTILSICTVFHSIF